MSSAITLTVVIPAFNQKADLQALLPALVAIVAPLVTTYEIIVVNDGSTDDTALAMQQWLARYPQLVYLQLPRRCGKDAALTEGLKAAQGHAVVCMDAGLPRLVSLIPTLVKRWRQGMEIVYGAQTTPSKQSWLKRLGAHVFYMFMRTCGALHVDGYAGDFRLMDRVVVDALLLVPERSRNTKGLFAWVDVKSECAVVPVDLSTPHFIRTIN